MRIKRTIIFDDVKTFSNSNLLDGIISRYTEQAGTSITVKCNGRVKFINMAFDLNFFDIEPGDKAEIEIIGPKADETFNKLVKFSRKSIRVVEDSE